MWVEVIRLDGEENGGVLCDVSCDGLWRRRSSLADVVDEPVSFYSNVLVLSLAAAVVFECVEILTYCVCRICIVYCVCWYLCCVAYCICWYLYCVGLHVLLVSCGATTSVLLYFLILCRTVLVLMPISAIMLRYVAMKLACMWAVLGRYCQLSNIL